MQSLSFRPRNDDLVTEMDEETDELNRIIPEGLI